MTYDSNRSLPSHRATGDDNPHAEPQENSSEEQDENSHTEQHPDSDEDSEKDPYAERSAEDMAALDESLAEHSQQAQRTLAEAKSAEAKKALAEIKAETAQRGISCPHWLADQALLAMPPHYLDAYTFVLLPTYQELVLEARPGLACSLGVTIVHLLWLELLDQFELQVPAPGKSAAAGNTLAGAPTPGDPTASALTNGTATAGTATAESSRDRHRLIDRHLRMVGAKLKAHDLLMRLREARLRCESIDNVTTRPEVLRERDRKAVERSRRKLSSGDFPTWE